MVSGIAGREGGRVNYYERHLGDYARDTRHLTMLEHGAYNVLMDRYYTTEKGIPEAQAYRVAGARTPEEKEAVDAVLAEFFKLVDGTWVKGRIEEEIAKYRDSSNDTEERRKHETERKRRYRARRSELFAELREHGLVPAFDTAIEVLEDMLSRVLSHGTGTGTGQSRDGEGTATHTPNTSHQSPVELGSTEAHTNVTTGDECDDGVCGPPMPDSPSPVVQAAILLRKRGCLVTPQNPDLIAAIGEGVTPQALDAMAELYPRKPANYVITAARRQHADGVTTITEQAHAVSTSGRKLSVAEQVQQNILQRRQREAEGDSAPFAAIGCG